MSQHLSAAQRLAQVDDAARRFEQARAMRRERLESQGLPVRSAVRSAGRQEPSLGDSSWLRRHHAKLSLRSGPAKTAGPVPGSQSGLMLGGRSLLPAPLKVAAAPPPKAPMLAVVPAAKLQRCDQVAAGFAVQQTSPVAAPERREDPRDHAVQEGGATSEPAPKLHHQAVMRVGGLVGVHMTACVVALSVLYQGPD